MKKNIAQIVVDLPVEGPFDFLIKEEQQATIQKGSRVYVSFQYRYVVGFVIGFLETSPFKRLKSIISVLDNTPALNENMLHLTYQFAQYYGCSWGEAITTSLPRTLRTKKVCQLSRNIFLPEGNIGKDKKNDQETILCLDQGKEKRWSVIWDLIKKTFVKNQSVLFLVPEVYQLSQIKKILSSEINETIVVFDKKLSARAECEEWIKIREGECRIAIGTRSAVFAPFPNLGLIVFWEEENLSYKQEQTPAYHARKVAEMRRELEGITLLYVSSSPSAEVWWQIKNQKFKSFFFEDKTLSPIQIVDLSNYNFQKKYIISVPVSNMIQDFLKKKGKILLFLNRRGFSTKIQCLKCGYTFLCSRCGTMVSYLYNQKKLVCHLCDSKFDLSEKCPKCYSPQLQFYGLGIEKLESHLARYYPYANIVNCDRETKNLSKKADIYIATQAIVKYLTKIPIDFIVVLDVDAELNRFDFRSSQRIFSLLIHFRQFAKEKVLVQSNLSDNYCLKAAQSADFLHFYQNEIRFRQELNFPPFSHLIDLGLRGLSEKIVAQQAQELYQRLKEYPFKGVDIMEPHPAILPKIREKYRYTINLKGREVLSMQKGIKKSLSLLKRKKNVIITINVDP